MAPSKTNGNRLEQLVRPNNKKLFVTCAIFSLLHFGLMLDAYLSDRDHVAYALIVLHGMLLALYVGPKELGRWFNGGHPSTRPGEGLVFLWIAGLAFMGVHSHFYPQYKIPEGMLDAVVTIVLILVGTETSKLIYGWRKSPCPEESGGKAAEPKPVDPSKTQTPSP